MFSADHEATVRELARVTGHNGRIALANRTPTGSEARVRELLGDWFELHFEEHVWTSLGDPREEYLLVLGIRR
jgi:hypothetical protein